MKLIEDLFQTLIEKLDFNPKFNYQEQEIDFKTPFLKMKFYDAIEKYAVNIDM